MADKLSALSFALSLLCGALVSGQERSLPANVQALLRDVWRLPVANEIGRARSQALLKKHAVSEDELLRVVKNNPKQWKAWKILLLAGSPKAKAEYARVFFGSDDPYFMAAHVTEDHLESEELTRALLPYLARAARRESKNHVYTAAVMMIRGRPVKAAIPVLKHFVLYGTRWNAALNAAACLATLNDPEALKALEGCWHAVRGDDPIRRALAHAVASYGDAGVEAMRRIYAARRDPYVFLGLRLVATPLAARVAEELHDPRDPASRRDLLLVNVAAGEPFCTRALRTALDDPSPLVRIEAVEGLQRHATARKGSELRALVRRGARFVALGHQAKPARRAWELLARWKYAEVHPLDHRRRKPGEIVWGDPVRGVSVGAGKSTYTETTPCCQDGEPVTFGDLQCRVHLRNTSKLLLRINHAWSIVDAQNSELRGFHSGYPGCSTTKPGETKWTGGAFRGRLLPYKGGKPIKFRFTVTVGPKDYHGAPGWLGTLVTPEFDVVVPRPVRNDDLAHWRAFLAECSRRGKLPDGGAITWSECSGGFRARTWWVFAIRGDRIEANGVWQALPQDLLVLNAEEVRRICSFLLEDDRFANTIDSVKGGGNYGPTATFGLESSTKRGVWSGSCYRRPVRERWHGLMSTLLAPRLKEARRRMGIPERPPASK